MTYSQSDICDIVVCRKIYELSISLSNGNDIIAHLCKPRDLL